MGPSISTSRYFGPILTPSSLSHFGTHPGTTQKVRHTSRNTPPFLVGLVQKTWTKAPCTNSLSIVRWGFCPGLLSGGLLSGRICPGWFLYNPSSIRKHLLENICYNRKLNITLHFMFHMYDKKFYKRDVTCSWPPPPCHKLSHLLGHPPPRA